MAMPFEKPKVEEDPVSISICEMLKSSSPTSTKPCISRVPNYLRQVNEKAYEPQQIAIGPYHHGKVRLKAMEKRKIDNLQQLREERKDIGVQVYVTRMRELEEKARKCYEEPVSLNSDDFVKILLLDGCFIVQLVRIWLKRGLECMEDWLVCYSRGFFNALLQDILLVENQLPFFVVWELFAMIETSVDHDIFIEAIFDMFECQPLGKLRPKKDLQLIKLEEIKHLLDFKYHHCCHPSTSEMACKETQSFDMKFICCATELQEAGIEFKVPKGNSINSMFDIRFENKTLHIPELCIEDSTESFLRNLVAYEQLFVADSDLKHATDYVTFMDYLIDSPKDVQILRQNEIIQSLLGNDKAVTDMINSLGTCVISSSNFYYSQVFKQVNEHCRTSWNKWMANLKHNYFNSPWALISFLATAFLLLLTLLQTIFSVLSHT